MPGEVGNDVGEGVARLGRLVKNRPAEQMVAYPPTSGWCTSPKSGGSRGARGGSKGEKGEREEAGRMGGGRGGGGRR